MGIKIKSGNVDIFRKINDGDKITIGKAIGRD